jgi:hypothetical protein
VESVAEQGRDKAGDEAVFVLHQPSNEKYQGRPPPPRWMWLNHGEIP